MRKGRRPRENCQLTRVRGLSAHGVCSPLSPRPLAAEDLDRRAGHVDVVVRGPLEVQVAAEEVERHLAVQPAGQHAGDATAQAPVPQASVSPLPRSQTRMSTSSG